ncbi:MAG: phosphomannomutase/phosphoglucomutase, partial [Candidatus Eisenbacteria bacterium]|nr:phosphomannomutase/phosphoglucomutase [Candidatus Eisenbacteria bacterium]
MNPNIFRQYDVRGVVDEDLTTQVVEDLGRAYGSAIKNNGGSKVGVGMDVRETSPPLRDALVRGILSTGIDVVRLGMVATPTVYYSVYALELDGAVQVTGSHNPIEYNGFKMMVGKGSLYGDAIQDLRRAIETQTFASGEGTVEDVDLDERYLNAIVDGIQVDRPLRLVLDAGNGCASLPAPKLFKALGCEVEELFCVPDGTFPNHIPDPTLPETLDRLRERVLATGADLGMAYDGDADRLGALDNTGRVVWGDQLLALFARSVLKEKPGAEILFEVKCSRALKDDIEAHGGVGIMTKTGHSLIKKAMKETGSPLAGEMSGHMFFADRWFGFDDAIYASARLAELIASSGKS